MADFPIVGVLLGLLVLLPIYFTTRLYPQIIFVVLSLAMTVLSGTGMYLTTDTGASPIFALFFILSIISLPITILHFMLTEAREWLVAMVRGRL